MKTLDEIMPVLQQLLTLVEQHFGNKCEVVLHDLTKDYNHTIVDIRNGDITHRPAAHSGALTGFGKGVPHPHGVSRRNQPHDPDPAH